MGVRSTGSQHPTTTEADGHLLEYFRQNFGAGGGGTNTSPAASLTGLTATGGIIGGYVDGSTIYRTHVFTSSGVFDVTAHGDFGSNVDVLIIGGGGGGGFDAGGGGGAGAFYPQPNVPVPVNNYTMAIGGGGSGSDTSPIKGAPGANTAAFGYTAKVVVVEAQTPHQRLMAILLPIHSVVQVVVVEEVVVVVVVEHMAITAQMVHRHKAVAVVVAQGVLEDHQDQEDQVLQPL